MNEKIDLEERLEIPRQSDKTRAYRLFEILPGLISWSMIIGAVPLAYFLPDIYAYFIIFYILSWVIRSFLIVIKTYLGYKLLKSIDSGGVNRRYKAKKSDMYLKSRYFSLLAKNRRSIQPASQIIKEDIVHMVVIPIYKEPFEVVINTVKRIADCNYDVKSRVVVILTYEERTRDIARPSVLEVRRQCEKSFLGLMVNEHKLEKQEVAGKGANISSCSEKIIHYCQKNNILPDNVIVTTLDADNILSNNYFKNMDEVYSTTSNPSRISLQPVAIYTNNIWRVPAVARMQAVNNTVWSVAQSVKPRIMRNFSSHAQSLASLIMTDFWSKRTIVEDGHQYWRSLLAFNGEYRVVPVYTSIGQDAVETEKYMGIFKAQFSQLRRWSYGASDIPYVSTKVLPSIAKNNLKQLPRATGLLVRLFDTHVTWATNSFMILLAPMLPAIMKFYGRYDPLSSRLPAIVSNIQSFAILSLLLIVLFSIIILPKDLSRPPSKIKRAGVIIQWLASPVIGIVYGSGASLVSQTRLMLGRYDDNFVVTDKRAAD